MFVRLSGFGLAVLLACATAASAAPIVTLSAPKDHPQAQLGVVGRGFGHGEAVDIFFDTTDVLLVVANATGRFTAHGFTVPANATPGQHWITAVGRRDGDAAQKPFYVRTNWAEHGFASRAKHVNPYENVIGAGNAANLDTAWIAPIGSNIFSSAIVSEGSVYVGSAAGFECAFNLLTGAQRWCKQISDTPATPAADANAVYFAAEDGTVNALSVSDGHTLWSTPVHHVIESSPAVTASTLYVGADDGNLYAFNIADGSIKWTKPMGGMVRSSPTVANGVVYVGCEDGTLRSFDATTGTAIWTVVNLGVIDSTPTVANGVVYVGSNNGHFYAANAITGTLLWNDTLAGSNYGSAAVVNGVVYVGSQGGRFYALNASTGVAIWSSTLGATVAAILSSPAYANGVVYVGSNDKSVYALNAATGAKLWSALTGDVVDASPAVVDGMVIVGSFDGRLYAYAPNGGTDIRRRGLREPPSAASLRPDRTLKPPPR